MPTGTTNPILKSSFSMTSLRSSTPTDNPETGASVRLKNERLYNSLTKKSRKCSEPDKESWRKSWGSVISQDGKEFWEGFQADYDYLMGQNILEKHAVEVTVDNGSTSIPTTPQVWSHSEFMDHFAQLYSWLKGIQDLVYGTQKNVTDWKLRAERQEEMQRQRFRLDTFNEQSKQLVNRYPELESEVIWLTKHVNDKWETVAGMMAVVRKEEDEIKCQNSRDKIEHDVKCLRRWLRELKAKLKPLSFQNGWTKAELEKKTKEHLVLHRDIEAHRKIVSSVFKLCEKADSSTRIAARALERKYHEYYLRSLEWQYHIESLLGLQSNKSPASWSNDSDGEPVAKVGRFTYCKDSEGVFDYEDDDQKALVANENSMQENNSVMNTTLPKNFSKGSLDMVGPLERGNQSILRIEDSSSMATTLGTKSKNSSDISGANHVEEIRPHFSTKLSTSSASFALSDTTQNSLKGKDKLAFENVPNAVESIKVKPPNVGITNFRHLDTDSEMEKTRATGKKKDLNAQLKVDVESKDDETSSGESWTYASESQNKENNNEIKKKSNAVSCLPQGETKNSPKSISGSNSVKVLRPISSSNRKLVDRADELVRYKPKTYQARNMRLVKHVKDEEDEKPLDSCDASGEYTEDSDEKESQMSEDNDGSIATCRSGSADGILDETLVAKSNSDFFQRGNKSEIRCRPWSLSNVYLTKNPRGTALKTRSSMSESALNQMMTQVDRSKDLYLTLQSSPKVINLDDVAWSNCKSSRRKRTKIRKRTNKSCNSASDGITLSGSDSAQLSSPSRQKSNTIGLVKSGSFSGVIRKQRDFSPSFKKCDSGSATETDEEQSPLDPPRFRLGPKAGAVTAVVDHDKIQVEDQASWDNYQEKYQSEAYSEELADSDTAKKLLEFGEDYWKVLGNQSDCASSWNRSMHSRYSNKFDSDSDVDDVKRFLRRSADQLDLIQLKLRQSNDCLAHAGNTSDGDSMSKTFLDEILTNCRVNVDRLTQILSKANEKSFFFSNENYIQNLKDCWETSKTTAELHKVRQLKSDMSAMKNELLQWAASIESMETKITSREELEAKIIQIKNELNLRKKDKSRLLQANVAVHRILSTAKHAEPTLRDEVTELYRVWDQTFCRVSSHLFNLQSLTQIWHDFDDHLSQLQSVLRTDTLKVIDFALQCGNSSSDVSSSLRDIAGLLSDHDQTTKDAASMKDESSVQANLRSPLLTVLRTEGSLSDSGISDSGSEQELSDREKRLAQLKRFAKRLESYFPPDSQAMLNMFKRIEELENGFRELQKTCKEVIVRSSSAEEFKMIVSETSSLAGLDAALENIMLKPSSEKKSKSKGFQKMGELHKEGNETENFEDGKFGKKSWLWRLVRFAIPLQLAFVALLCVACMMEPPCCDSLNNLERSLSLQLRYDSGPPPV